jgi:hypothetical protein
VGLKLKGPLFLSLAFVELLIEISFETRSNKETALENQPETMAIAACRHLHIK